jgi:hypothetical protein
MRTLQSALPFIGAQPALDDTLTAFNILFPRLAEYGGVTMAHSVTGKCFILAQTCYNAGSNWTAAQRTVSACSFDLVNLFVFHAPVAHGGA